MANFCLMPQAIDKFKQAIRDGTITPEKLTDMTSAERRDLFAGLIGKDSAKDVNALFESKTLLKNQEQGFVTWAKKVTNMTPAARTKLTDKIAKIDHLLTPEEEKSFLHDLVSTKLGTDVTADEARQIAGLSRTVQEAQALPRSTMDESAKKNWQPTANDMKYGRALYDFNERMGELRNEAKQIRLKDLRGRNIVDAPAHMFKMVADVSKSIGASLDDSFALRQGFKAFWTNNAAWRKSFVQSFGNIIKGFANRAQAERELTAHLMADPAYDQAVKDGLAIRGNEDVFPTSLPEKIPILGRAFSASEIAYNHFAEQLRLDIYKQEMRAATSLGSDVPKNFGKNMAKMVNSLTGRGGFGSYEPIANKLNVAFYSARFIKANFDTIIAHPLGIGIGGIGSVAQKRAAGNLIKVIGGITSTLMLANALKPGSVDFDPRSADFGKIKVGHTRFDVSGGMGSLLTLGARVSMGLAGQPAVKSSTTGIVSKVNTGEYGAPTVRDVIVDFLANKLSPVGGVAEDFLVGKTHDNQKPTVANESVKLVEPLNVGNIIELAQDPNAANTVAATLLDMLGIATNTYGKSSRNYSLNPSPTLQAFHDKVGDETFSQANADYNTKIDQFMQDNKSDLAQMNDADKAATISGAKAKIQANIYKQYGFKPTRTKPNATKTRILKSLH